MAIESEPCPDRDKTEDPQLALYYFEVCPYCWKVRTAAKRFGIKLELRDIHRVAAHREELLAARGRPTVPVLRIEAAPGRVHWLPESEDIIRWLAGHASSRPGAAPGRQYSRTAGHARRAGALKLVFAAVGALAVLWIGRQLLAS